MWTRAELKERAKAAFKRNYWKTVLVGVIVMALAGAIGASTGSNAASRSFVPGSHVVVSGTDHIEWGGEDFDLDNIENLEGFEDLDLDEDDLETLQEQGINDINVNLDGDDGLNVSVTGEHGNTHVHVGAPEMAAFGIFGLFMGLVFGALALVGLAIGIAIAAFLINPVSVGTSRFFLTNLNERAEIREVAYAFDHNYLEIVKTMFWRDLKIFLWSLLLIVPGIIKAYELRMVPYLLADNPTMDRDRAFSESRAMMDGQKWKAFVLDLSFLGWWLLSVITLGIVAVFYATPYKCMTDAALYEKLRYGLPTPASSPAPNGPTAPTLDLPGSTFAAGEVPVPPFASVGAPAPAWDAAPMAAETDVVELAAGPTTTLEPAAEPELTWEGSSVETAPAVEPTLVYGAAPIEAEPVDTTTLAGTEPDPEPVDAPAAVPEAPAVPEAVVPEAPAANVATPDDAIDGTPVEDDGDEA